MKQVFFLTLICAFGTIAKAQDNPFTIGFFLAPAYSDRFNVEADLLRKLFVGKYAYSLGIFAQKKLTHRFDVRFGANFVNNGEQMLRRSTWVGNVGFVPTNESKELIANFYNIELPIDIQWFIHRKKHFFIALGASPSYNLFDSGILKLYSGDRLTSTITSNGVGDKGIALAVQGGIGYQKRLNKNLLFEIQPKFRTYVTKFSNSRAMYNIALQLGLIF